MRRVMVRYRVKPDQVAENEQLVRDVYAELARVAAGRASATARSSSRDGVSFVHLADARRANPLGSRGVPAVPGGNPRPLRRAAGRHRARGDRLVPLRRSRS